MAPGDKIWLSCIDFSWLIFLRRARGKDKYWGSSLEVLQTKWTERALQTTKIDLIHFFYRYWHLGFVPLNVFQNKNTQTFCYKSLLSWFFVNVNATCIGKFYFKQIYRHCNATNAKTNDFRNLFQFYSYSGILLIEYALNHMKT